MANLILNPSFETDTNADGLADNWTVTKTVSGTVTTSRVAGLFGSYAQRLDYTSAGDSAKGIYLLSDITAAGTVSEGQALSGGLWVRAAAFTGAVNLTMYTYAVNAAGTTIATVGWSVISFNLMPPNTWVPLPLGYGVLPALSSRTRVAVQVSAIDTGDSVTLDIDGAYLSPDANFDHYGKYPVIGKGAVLL